MIPRYAVDGGIKARSGTPVTGSPGSPQAVGVQDQLGKVTTTPNTQTGVSGLQNRHNSHDTNLTRRKGAEDPEGMLIDSSQGLVRARARATRLIGMMSMTTLAGQNTEENTVLPH